MKYRKELELRPRDKKKKGTAKETDRKPKLEVDPGLDLYINQGKRVIPVASSSGTRTETRVVPSPRNNLRPKPVEVE